MTGQKLQVIKLKRLDEAIITAELMTIKDDLKDFYEEIECSTIDIICRRIGGNLFDIICDDEALINGRAERERLPISWWQDTEGHNEGLWGTLLLCHHNDEGELLDAKEDEILCVQKAYREIKSAKGKEIVILFHDIY